MFLTALDSQHHSKELKQCKDNQPLTKPKNTRQVLSLMFCFECVLVHGTVQTFDKSKVCP